MPISSFAITVRTMQSYIKICKCYTINPKTFNKITNTLISHAISNVNFVTVFITPQLYPTLRVIISERWLWQIKILGEKLGNEFSSRYTRDSANALGFSSVCIVIALSDLLWSVHKTINSELYRIPCGRRGWHTVTVSLFTRTSKWSAGR